ncbi:MAG: hypothetical protein AAF560_19910 [Acidobacteriota bacterium]
MWLEAITVRTPELGDLERQIPVLVQQLTADSPEVEVAAYVRCPANHDLSFHLIREEGSGEVTSQGLHLAEALRAYGTVDHTIWQRVSPHLSGPSSFHTKTSRQVLPIEAEPQDPSCDPTT